MPLRSNAGANQHNSSNLDEYRIKAL